MLNFEKEQKVVEIGNTRIGGLPGENPVAMIATVFYTNHAALLDEKTGKINKKLVEQELNDYSEIIEETGMQGIVDVVGGYPDALFKECEYVADIVDYPFLVDGLNDDSRIPVMESLKEVGLLDRAILNSIDEATTDENLAKLKEIGVKSAVLLTFGNRYIFPQKKLEFLKTTLIPKAQKANIENLLVDTAVLDLPSIGINVETTRLVKSELGLPTGFAPANAIYGWDFIKKYGDSSRCGGIASLMAYCVNAGSDFVLFLISGINSYYRKRILRKKISDRTPLKHIF